MKAFLLSAGRGTRLRPLTDKIPKCLIQIRGTPMLAIWLEICRRTGIREVLINLHWKPEVVRRFLTGFRTPVKILTTHEPQLLGSAGTVRQNWNWVRDERRFWVIYTDLLTTANLRELARFDEKKEGILTLGLHRVTDPRGCGLATLNQRGRVVAFKEKPKHPRGNLAFAGMLLAHPGLIDYLPQKPALDFGHDVFPRLAGRMWGYTIRHYLVDIGTRERLALAEQTWPGIRKRARK